MTSYAERGIGRRIKVDDGWRKHKGKADPVFHPELVIEQHWQFYVAAGPLRETEAQVEADLALLEAGNAEVVAALRELIFLAGEAVGDDPDDTEVMALVRISALVDLLEVAAG